VANQVAFNGDVLRELASQFLTLAEKQGAVVPLMVGHRIMGASLVLTGDFAAALAHFDQSLGLYDAAEHRSLATQFGQDVKVKNLSYRALTLWLLGYPEAARADAEHAIREAREIGQAATLMLALAVPSYTLILCRAYVEAGARIDELVVLADEKRAPHRKAEGMNLKGSLLASVGKSSDAVQMLTCGIKAWRSTGATIWMPLVLSCFARAYVELGQFDHA
jgi:hypothetical protein